MTQPIHLAVDQQHAGGGHEGEQRRGERSDESEQRHGSRVHILIKKDACLHREEPGCRCKAAATRLGLRHQQQVAVPGRDDDPFSGQGGPCISDIVLLEMSLLLGVCRRRPPTPRTAAGAFLARPDRPAPTLSF